MILAIESSTTTISLALYAPGDAREVHLEVPRNRGGAMFSELEKLLASGVSVSRVVVGLGPGSYNGIRTALAAGWGISAVRGVPLVGLSSLLGLADGSYCAVGDARRQQAYFARVENGDFAERPCLLEIADLPARLATVGDMPLYSSSVLKEAPQAIPAKPSALRLATLGALRDPESAVPEPIYLKPAYINLPPARVA